MTFQVLNDKNMFARFEFSSVMSVHGFTSLKNHVAQHWDQMSAKEQKAWNAVWDIATQLPQRKMHSMGLTGDFAAPTVLGHPSKRQAYATAACLCIINPKRFVSRAQNNQAYPSNSEKWGLDAAIDLSPYNRMIEKFIATHDLPLTFNSNVTKRAVDIKKRLDGGEYKIQAYDPIANLAEVEACVIFVRGHNGAGGYLNHRGGWGPLGGARLFESSGAAYTTIRSQGISSAAVVHIGTQVLRLDEQSTMDEGFENLQEAMGIVERKRIQKALDEATHEQLLEKLVKFEQHSEIQASVKKKKM